MKEKAFALFSVLCLLLTCLPLTALAVAEDTEFPCAAVSGQSQITNYSPENSENKAMPLASESLDFADNTPVQYTYQLTYYENDTSRVGVDLHFTVGEDALAYSFSADGDVARMELNDTTVMLRGPLYGTFMSNDMEYSFSASFTKLEGSDDVNIGLVITSTDFTYQKMYSFGMFVMTEDVHTAWTEYRSQHATALGDMSDANASPTDTRASSDYVYIGSDYGAIGPTNQTSLSGDGNRLGGFVDNENKRVILTLSSYCHRFDSSSFSTGTFLSAYVQDFEIGLEQTSSACYISGIRDVEIPGDGDTADLDFVFSTADTLLGLLPPPYNAGASIILSILQLSSPATFEYLDRFDHQRIRVDGGTWSEINLDDAPLPIEFQLANSSTSPKTFTGIGYASLTYVADVYDTVFYIPTETAEVYISVTNVD